MCWSSRSPTRFHCEQLWIKVSYTLSLLSTITQCYCQFSQIWNQFGHQEVGLFTFEVSEEYLLSILPMNYRWCLLNLLLLSHLPPKLQAQIQESLDILSLTPSNSVNSTLNWCPSPWAYFRYGLRRDHRLARHPARNRPHPSSRSVQKIPPNPSFLYHNYHRPSSGPWSFHLNAWNNLFSPRSVRIFLFKAFNGSLSILQ